MCLIGINTHWVYSQRIIQRPLDTLRDPRNHSEMRGESSATPWDWDFNFWETPKNQLSPEACSTLATARRKAKQGIKEMASSEVPGRPCGRSSGRNSTRPEPEEKTRRRVATPPWQTRMPSQRSPWGLKQNLAPLPTRAKGLTEHKGKGERGRQPVVGKQNKQKHGELEPFRGSLSWATKKANSESPFVGIFDVDTYPTEHRNTSGVFLA